MGSNTQLTKKIRWASHNVDAALRELQGKTGKVGIYRAKKKLDRRLKKLNFLLAQDVHE